jgi:hypothetical protein
VRPCLPVVLVEGVLDRADVVLLDVAVVEVGELFAGEPLGGVRVGVLTVSASEYGRLDPGLTLKSRSYLPSL